MLIISGLLIKLNLISFVFESLNGGIDWLIEDQGIYVIITEYLGQVASIAQLLMLDIKSSKHRLWISWGPAFRFQVALKTFCIYNYAHELVVAASKSFHDINIV